MYPILQPASAPQSVEWAQGTNATHILHYEPGPNGTTYVTLNGINPNQSIFNGTPIDPNHAEGLKALFTIT